MKRTVEEIAAVVADQRRFDLREKRRKAAKDARLDAYAARKAAHERAVDDAWAAAEGRDDAPARVNRAYPVRVFVRVLCAR